MTDEKRITQMPNFYTTNWFANSDFCASNPINNPNFNVFESNLSLNNQNFDSFNSYSQSSCNTDWFMQDPCFSSSNYLNFSFMNPFTQNFNLNFDFSKIFSDNPFTNFDNFEYTSSFSSKKKKDFIETPKLKKTDMLKYETIIGNKRIKTYKSLVEHQIPQSDKNLNYWKSLGYNEKKGQEFAEYMFSNAHGFDGYCAKNVRLGINEVFYNGQTHYEGFGEAGAWRVGMDYFSKDPNCKFKKINVNNIDMTKDTLPPGTITIYGQGYTSGKNWKYGHIEVADGKRHGASDGITNYIKTNPIEIWIPV